MKNQTIKYKTAGGFRYTEEFIQSLDYTKRDCELSAETGVLESRIYAFRRRMGKPTVPHPSLTYWSNPDIDWTKPSAKLAIDHEVRVVIVWYWRRRLGKPLVAPVTPKKAHAQAWSPNALWGF